MAEDRGIVYLVGAGPGDPGLITLRGVECLAQADVVIYDALVNRRLLDHAPRTAERLVVREHPRACRMSQDELNRLLVEHARAGRRVVRLKGGDPFVFGRGGEEAEALAAAGIPFEVVPGVTAGVAAPAYAGIPVTHRQRASTVVFLTGHEDPLKSASAIDWEALARFSGTIVIYMGLGRLAQLVEALVRAGKAPQTPAAVVQWGSLPEQRTVSGTLATLADAAQAAGVGPPVVIVVGDVVELRQRLRWFETLPLVGQRIVLTRPEGQSQQLARHFEQLGAQVLLMPVVRIEPPDDWRAVDDAAAWLDQYDWVVFTSANGVRFFFRRLLELGRDARALGRVKLAAIGPGTVDALAEHSLRPDLMPGEYRSEALAAELAPLVRGRRVLLLRADRGRVVLEEKLRTAGAQVERVTVYRNLDETDPDRSILQQISQGEVDWVTLTSSSIARAFANLLDDDARRQMGRVVKLATLSPVTTAAVRQLGLEVAAEAKEYTMDGLVAAIVAHARAARREEPT